MKTTILSSLALAALASITNAQSTYKADWNTLSGSNGSYSVNMLLSTGPAANGISSYTLNIAGDPNRVWLNGNNSSPGNVALTSSQVATVQTFSFSIASAPTSIIDTVMTLQNFSNQEGTLLNPTGVTSSSASWPYTVAQPSGSITTKWNSASFGFDAGAFVTEKGAQKVVKWDEWTVDISQSFKAVPEPSSTMLLGLGSLGLLIRRKR